MLTLPLRAFTRSRQQSRRNRNCIRPKLERLEDRTLPSTASPVVQLVPTGGLPQGGPGQPNGFSPSQIAQAYGFNQITFNNGTVTGNGSGQTIAIVDAYDQPNIAGDLATFDSMYGLPAPPSFIKVNESGGTSYPAANETWGLEISLDVEWAHALAPGANILLVEATTNSWSDLMQAENYARNQPGVSVVSMSLAGSEWSTETGFNSFFTTPSGHTGVAFVAASGDGGSSGGPQFPAVCPNVLGVGGTQLATDSQGNYISETGWSYSGGGISAYESQPSYQQGVVTQSSTMRTVPDVAYNASTSSAYALYDTSFYNGWVAVGGTSAGAPQWSALIAIADQGRALDGLGTLDSPTLLSALYTLPAGDFHEITTGSNGAYQCGPGYNLVTGLGSPYANLIAAALNASQSNNNGQEINITTPASATPAPVTGTSTSLTVTANDTTGLTLSYSWSVTSYPAGAQPVTFADKAAQNTTAAFHMAGSYTFLITVTDSAGNSATSSVSVTVLQTGSSVAVSPRTVSLVNGSFEQFSATALDQFGNALATQPTFTWSLASGSLGALGSSGLYTAPANGTGTASVQASSGGLTGSATVAVGSKPAAPSNLLATTTSGGVKLTWTANSNNQTHFVIQRSTNGTNWISIATVGPNVTSFTDTRVSKLKTYYYRVYATNKLGNSGYSNVATVTVPSLLIVETDGADVWNANEPWAVAKKGRNSVA